MTAAEDADRRLHWLRFARELGQEDDFRALMDDLKREGPTPVCSNCEADTFACTACGARVES